jgi:uncharacterized membrane protein YdbT with pleckstrin-like domain
MPNVVYQKQEPNLNTTKPPVPDTKQNAASINPDAKMTPLEKLPFELQNGEKIIRELKPQFFGFMVSSAIGSYLGLLFLLLFAVALGIVLLSGVLAGFLSAIFLRQVSEGLVLSLAVVPITLLVIISIKPFISYGKSWYWITSIRVIGKRGFLGYKIDSIPLENVSDVVLSRSLLDRFLGLSSLVIVPMGNSSNIDGGTPDENFQNANFFPALPQKVARELQRVLFNLRDELRKSHEAHTSSGATDPRSSEVAQAASVLPRGT